MTSQAMPPHWLIVVQRDRRDLYENLSQSFEADARVEVILDRRRVDRRVETVPAEIQRRREQRRKPPPPHELAFLEYAGFCLIYERVEPLKLAGPKANPARGRLGTRPRGRGVAAGETTPG